jgi:hypothetical protein
VRAFENGVLTRILGPKREEMTGCYINMHKDEFHNLYPSPDINKVIKLRRKRWAGHAARMVEMRNAFEVLVVQLEARRPLERPRRRWEDSTKLSLKEIGLAGVNCIRLASDSGRWRALVNMVISCLVP